MTRQGLRSRALFNACAYVFMVSSVIGLPVTASFALVTDKNVPRGAAVTKIGPGYARMQPIDQGKPEKVLYTTPYSIPARARVASVKRPAKSIKTLISQSAPSVRVAVAEAPLSISDIHRIY